MSILRFALLNVECWTLNVTLMTPPKALIADCASQRSAMAKLLRGSVATNVAQQLPDSIQLLIFG